MKSANKGGDVTEIKWLTILFIFWIVYILFVTNGFAQTTFMDVSDSLNQNYQRCSVGTAWGDYDNDGDLDLYVVNLGQSNVLYQNNGNGSFNDVANIAGVDDSGDGVGCAWADFDNDGYIDIFVSNRPGQNRLYLNNRDGTFTDITSSAGVSDPIGNGESVAWADYNNDGFVDIYVLNYLQSNRLYSNNKDSTFHEVTDSAGVGHTGRGEGVAWADFDNDGDCDIFVANYNGSNVLYLNNGDGMFEDITNSAGVGGYTNSFGVAWGDYDNDGDLDLYIAQNGTNTLYANKSDGTFENMTSIAGVGGSSWSLGAAWSDYNNDGWLDLYVANHLGEDNFYLNNRDGTFTEVTSQAGITNLSNARGCIWGDYDNDGDLDLFIANHDYQFNKLYRNEGCANHWLIIKTVGTISNYSGIGARLEARVQNTRMIREISGGSGFASQNSLPVEFGLGSSIILDTLIVKWPSGLSDTLFSIEADTIIMVTEEITGIEDMYQNPIPQKAGLIYKISPNPFSKKTTVSYKLSVISKVSLKVYDLAGRLVRTLLDEEVKAGNYTVDWDGMDMSSNEVQSGVYFLKAEGFKPVKIVKLR